jgi:hypothetical protein
MGYLWKHCENGHELTHPTLVDKLVGHVVCPDCRVREPIDDDVRRWAVEELVERLEAVEANSAKGEDR